MSKFPEYTHEKSKEWFSRALAAIPSGVYGHLGPSEGLFLPINKWPLMSDHAKGTYFWDVDGNKYLDLMCAYGPNVLGYCDEDVDAAAIKQLHTGNCTTSPSYKMVECAELLKDTVACADWAFFMKNGSDATTFSVMCARAHTGKKKMFFLKGYYHGDFQWAQKVDYPGILPEEVQLVEEFVDVILSLTHMRNVDVYVSGSNSRFLSSDVVTEFRGRGDEIRIWPLTFDEYFNGIGGDIRKAWLDYYTFGGLPQVALLETEEKKTDYLRGLYETTYLRDVIERNHLRNPEGMKELVRVLASGIGSSTNPTRIASRHSKKGKQWIKDRYWHNIRGNSWTFAAKFKKSNGKEDQLTLLKLASSFPFLQYTQIKGDMNPFDADCRLYFNKRMKSKMLVTLKGRKSLLYLWEKQGRKCPICGEPIDTHKAWNVMPTVQDGRKCNLLVHDECFKLSRKNNGNKK